MVTHPEINRFFMLIPEACRLVLQAATIGKGGEIFVFDMGQPVRILDLAKRMIELSGQRNIKIEFSGLRPGEKLYEEVLNDKETVLPTVHHKIKIAKVRDYDYQVANQQIEDMIELSRSTYDAKAIVKAMKDMVPEYQTSQLEAVKAPAKVMVETAKEESRYCEIKLSDAETEKNAALQAC